MIRKIASPVITFISLCLIVTLLLAASYLITAPKIAGNAQLAADKARSEVLPESDGFTRLTDAELAENVTEVYTATNGAGYAITSTVSTDAGDITVITGIDLLGNIKGIRITDAADGSVNNEVLQYSDVYIQSLKRTYGSTARIDSLLSEISGDEYSASDILNAVSAALMEMDILGGRF